MNTRKFSTAEGESVPFLLYQNEDKNSSGFGSVRFAFPSLNIIIKLFDTQQKEKFSLKFWSGTDLDTVASYWNTKPTDREPTIDELNMINEAFSSLKKNAPAYPTGLSNETTPDKDGESVSDETSNNEDKDIDIDALDERSSREEASPNVHISVPFL